MNQTTIADPGPEPEPDDGRLDIDRDAMATPRIEFSYFSEWQPEQTPASDVVYSLN